MKKSRALGSDTTNPASVKVSAAPFNTSWANNLPSASMQGVVSNPGGTLSPMALAGVGKKRGKK